MSSNKDGKRIEGIHLGKKKVIIRFKDSKLDITPNTYTEFRLYEGKVLSDEEIKEIKKVDSLDIYLSYAKKLVLGSYISEQILKDKLLAKGAKPRQITYIVKELKKYSLIDDEALAKTIVDDCLTKHYGINRIKDSLIKKGIPLEIVNSMNIECSKENVLAILPKLEKKFGRYNYKAKCDHIYNALLRLGYSYEEASEVISHVSSKDSRHELEVLKSDYLKLKKTYSKKYKVNELNQKINEALLRKGYSYKDIKQIKGD